MNPGAFAPRTPLGISIASAFAALQPGGEGLVLHATECRKLHAAQSTVLILIENALPVLAGTASPPEGIGFNEIGNRRLRGRD
ncbi:hypothetical protein SDC9_164047 [bioreactor metagenome]|uniref:Uncharacterized protein n=1 Tax=bioreactor metagenome TaxID=1076179 RepID=A0A645FSU7_9ZZZZ